MICGSCADEWNKLDLTIPYPTPQLHFDFNSVVPARVAMFCRRIPHMVPPTQHPMEIDRYPTPPIQERAQNFNQASRPEIDQPLFIPEDDCTFPSHLSSVCFDLT